MSYILVHIYYVITVAINYFAPNHDSKFYTYISIYTTNFFDYKYMPTLIYYHQFRELP